jgi:hypothetical protein
MDLPRGIQNHPSSEVFPNFTAFHCQFSLRLLPSLWTMQPTMTLSSNISLTSAVYLGFCSLRRMPTCAVYPTSFTLQLLRFVFRKIIRHIRSSPQRRRNWESVVKMHFANRSDAALMLILDVKTTRCYVSSFFFSILVSSHAYFVLSL